MLDPHASRNKYKFVLTIHHRRFQHVSQHTRDNNKLDSICLNPHISAAFTRFLIEFLAGRPDVIFL